MSLSVYIAIINTYVLCLCPSILTDSRLWTTRPMRPRGARARLSAVECVECVSCVAASWARRARLRSSARSPRFPVSFGGDREANERLVMAEPLLKTNLLQTPRKRALPPQDGPEARRWETASDLHTLVYTELYEWSFAGDNGLWLEFSL